MIMKKIIQILKSILLIEKQRSFVQAIKQQPWDTSTMSSSRAIPVAALSGPLGCYSTKRKHGRQGSTGTSHCEVKIDVLTSKNNSASYDVVDDDESSIPSTTTGGETRRISQDNTTLDNGSIQYSSKYTGRYDYGGNSDGAVIGPFSGSEFRIFVDIGGT